MDNAATIFQKRKKEFEQTLARIERDEQRLKALEQELLNLQQRMASESAPIVNEFCQLRFENLTKLKIHLGDSFFKKKEIRRISHLMVEMAQGLIQIGDERGQAFLDELIPEEVEMDEAEDYSYERQEHHYKPAPPKEKAEEGKLEIKTLFRQLAKAFHPDKEQQEHLKEEKTALMKKITAAYENQDLYGLLKIEKDHMAPREFTADKIDLYLKHINDRLKELRAFENRLKKSGPLATVYRFIYARKTTIQEYNIRNELSKIEDELEKEKDLQNILWDKGSLRSYLR